MLFAVIGTALSALALAVLLFIVGKIGFHPSLPFVDCFMFGSLIAAVDPIATLGIFKVSASFLSRSARLRLQYSLYASSGLIYAQ